MRDITSPKLLKLKGILFALLAILSAILLLMPDFSWQNMVLLGICVWAGCRAYYFCFYVMEHYVDASFKYTGLLALLRQLMKTGRR